MVPNCVTHHTCLTMFFHDMLELYGTKYSRMDQKNLWKTAFKNFTWPILEYFDSYVCEKYQAPWEKTTSEKKTSKRSILEV